MPRNRRTILNVEVIHYPCKCEPFSKIGGLSLVNIELKLSEDCQWFIGQTAIPCYLFVAVDLLIFHILMIPNKDASGSRQLSANA